MVLNRQVSKPYHHYFIFFSKYIYLFPFIICYMSESRHLFRLLKMAAVPLEAGGQWPSRRHGHWLRNLARSPGLANLNVHQKTTGSHLTER